MKFVDEVKIQVKSGDGGPGSVSFRREKYVPRGGPDGGDGGKGGDVLVNVSHHLNSLIQFRSNKLYKASNGSSGSGQNQTGTSGKDLVLEVPPGTVIKDSEGNLLLDVGKNGNFVFLEGGIGGRGNYRFRSSLNQAPRHAQVGRRGFLKEISLELRSIADVGLIGYPNVGKSTLISVLSSARPKVADYPFTTLQPNLGVSQVSEDQSFVIADIPGIIPGAHKGVGLGLKFLRHIYRTKVFLHLVEPGSISGRNPINDFKNINFELEQYDQLFNSQKNSEPLSEKIQILALNKCDSISEDEKIEIEFEFKKLGIKIYPISSAAGRGIKELKGLVFDKIQEFKNKEEDPFNIEFEMEAR